MSYLPPEKKDKNAISPMRVALWVLVAGVGVYMVASGLIGVANGG